MSNQPCSLDLSFKYIDLVITTKIVNHVYLTYRTSYIDIIIVYGVIYPINSTNPTSYIDVFIPKGVIYPVYLTYPTRYIDIVIAAGSIIFTSVPFLPLDLVTKNTLNIVHFTCNPVALVVNNSRGISTLEFKIPYKDSK